MTDCSNKQKNIDQCNCSYPGCSRKGLCCECVHYHRRMNQLPGCFFPKDGEATWDRSYTHFARLYSGQN